ncbi:hypothetical protein HDU97_004353 [Phlyctochytrium planicorne]|nr:hypothetical protein HDU97_004353 [Phlyctochytrium planicorne]
MSSRRPSHVEEGHDTIESLAQEHKELKNAGKTKSFLQLFSIPIWVLISVIMSGAIASITVPMFIMISSTSQISLNDLSRRYIHEAVARASENLESAIFNVAGALDGMFDEPYFSDDVLAYIKFGLEASPKLRYEMLRRVQSYEYITGIMCTTYGTTAMGPYGAFTNVTLFFSGYNQGNLIFAHADPSTNYTASVGVYTPELLNFVMSFNVGPLGIVKPEEDLIYKTLIPGNPVQRSFLGISYYRFYYPANSSIGVFGCYIGVEVEQSLVPLLQSVTLTNNTVVMLIEKKSGLLIGTNKSNSTQVNNTRVSPEQSPNRNIAFVGEGLLKEFSNFTASTFIPDSSIAIRERQLDDGETWFLAVSLFTVKSEDFLVVVAFPRSDMFAGVDAGAFI